VGVPGSVLRLAGDGTEQRENALREAAAALNVAPERIIFAKTMAMREDHMARLSLCDLQLDTLSISSSAAMLDALWCGVPALTVKGDRAASRLGASLLGAIGLDDLVCASLPEYEARAVALAKDTSALAEVKQRTAANRHSHPLFKPDVFARNLEAVILEITDNENTGALRR
jgi:predicted O-linked N-acetylglucosamine transferase (SPINDLY family)